MTSPAFKAPRSLPDAISHNTAWTAFNHIFHDTDWRLRIDNLSPLAFIIENDDAFGEALRFDDPWHTKAQARHWVAFRILEIVDDLGNTYVRRHSLQVPETTDGPVAEALLANLKRRIEDTVRRELTTHFNTSTAQWEREVMDYTSRLEDGTDQWLTMRYFGADQLVSVDAARKAIRFVFFRTHWHLAEADHEVVLMPDWRFEQLRTQRSSIDETLRARSLVARCIETLCEKHHRRVASGDETAPLNRAHLKAEIDRCFQDHGVWGLIDIALPRDRRLNRLRLPETPDAVLSDLVERQGRRSQAYVPGVGDRGMEASSLAA